MKSKSLLLLAALSALVGVELLSGCAAKGPEPARASRGAPLRPDGTSDTGGGMGADNQVYDHYIVVPTDLPAYKKYLKPLFDNLREDDGKSGGLERFFQSKTWYVAPVDLERIAADALGISVVKTEPQPIARQTLRAVWIDSRIYNIGSAADPSKPVPPEADPLGAPTERQGDILLHEFVESLYLLKFKPIADLCRVAAFSVDNCEAISAQLDKDEPPEKPRALNADDNENIRSVAGWIKQNALKPISADALRRLLVANGFDRRIFKTYSAPPEAASPIVLNEREYIEVLKGTEASGNLPTTCTALSSREQKRCSLKFEETKISRRYGDAKLEFSAIRTTITVDGEKPVTINSLAPAETTLPPSSGSFGSFYLTALVDWAEKIHFGDRVYVAELVLTPDARIGPNSLTVSSILLRPGIVISTDFAKRKGCATRAPKVNKFMDDLIVMRNDVSSSFGLERTLAEMPGSTICDEANVEP